MPLTETQDADGRLTLERRLRPVKRALGGTIFGVIAALILHTFVGLLVFYVQEATREQFREHAAGFVLIFLGFLLFAVPSWMFFFWRGRVVIAPREDTILRENDYWLLRRRRSFRVDEVEKVKLWRYGGDSAPVFPVLLVMKDGTRVTVAEEPVKDLSKKLARRVAALLRVPCENLT
jgi:hypothetical protein